MNDCLQWELLILMLSWFLIPLTTNSRLPISLMAVILNKILEGILSLAKTVIS